MNEIHEDLLYLSLLFVYVLKLYNKKINCVLAQKMGYLWFFHTELEETIFGVQFLYFFFYAFMVKFPS